MSSYYNWVQNNTCTYNALSGIYLYSANNNTVVGNYASYSVYSNGIEVESASYNVVQNNTCNYDLLNGIELDSNYGPASYNNLTNNYCCYNQQQDGIWLHVDNAAINNNTIVNNTCTNNGVYPLGGQGGYGIGLMSSNSK